MSPRKHRAHNLSEAKTLDGVVAAAEVRHGGHESDPGRKRKGSVKGKRKSRKARSEGKDPTRRRNERKDAAKGKRRSENTTEDSEDSMPPLVDVSTTEENADSPDEGRKQTKPKKVKTHRSKEAKHSDRRK